MSTFGAHAAAVITRRNLLTVSGALLVNGARARSAVGAPLYELRSYAMVPGRRAELVAMFESVFLDAYERGGTRVLGTFTTPDDDDRWIWLRAFPDAAARGAALANFYGSAAWRERAAAANATIADTSDVLLLHAVAGRLGDVAGAAAADAVVRAAGDAAAATMDADSAKPPATIECRVHCVEPRGELRFAQRWLALAVPRLRALGAAPFAVLATDRRENTYPRQPVRDDSVVVTFTRFESLAAHGAALERCARDPEWRDRIEPAFARARRGLPEIRRLLPTDRSPLR